MTNDPTPASLVIGHWSLVIGHFAIGLLLSIPSSSLAWGGPPEGDLEKLVRDWAHRRDALRSMRWVITGKVLVPKGTYSTKDTILPAEDFTYDTKVTWVFDYAANRFRKEVVQQTFNPRKGGFVPSHGTFLFDAATTTTKRFFPREDNPLQEEGDPQLGIIAHANRVDYDLSDYPVFLSQYNVFPLISLTSLLGPVQLRPPLNPDRFLKGKTQSSNDRTYLIVRLFASDEVETDIDEFWVDPAAENRIVRADSLSQGKPFARSEIAYSMGKRFPTGWTTTVYRQDPEDHLTVLRVDRLTVQEAIADAEIDPSLFQIALQPGMVVRKVDALAGFAKNYAATDYRVAPDGKDLIEIGAGKGPDWHSRLVPFLVLFAVLLGGVLWQVLRRKRPAG
jgi:hypothetical protein